MDRREQYRVPYRCEVETDGFRNGQISDLSLGGAFIDSLNTVPVGTKLALRFRLKNHDFKVTGQVRHNIPQIGIGIRFDELDEDQQRVLAEFIWESTGSGRPIDEAA